MQLNQPYEPRYNAKIYIPKLTEEQRRVRATPLENLLSLRTRLAATAAQVEAPAPGDVVTEAPAPEEDPESRHVSDTQGAPVSQDVPVVRDMPVVRELSAPPEMPANRDVPAPRKGSPSHYIPTALEILCADFPEIFAPQSEGPLSLLPRLRWVEDAPGRRMQSPELRSASTSTRSSTQTLRSAPPGLRSSSITVHAP